MRTLTRSVSVLAVAGALAACGSSGSGGTSSAGSESGTKAPVVEVRLTDDGCDPNALTVPAGPTTFHVSNPDAAGVTEFEVLQGGRIVGEVENVAPGLDRSFSLTLKPGSYTTKCTGGKKEAGTLTVTEATAATAATPGSGSAAPTAVAS